LFTVDESDVYYNLTLTVTDDDGATATYNDNQFIQDLAPEINITAPDNRTFFDYNQSYEVLIENDGDNVPQEDITCSIYNNGNLTTTKNLEEGSNNNKTVNGTHRNGLGTHTFKASCSDPAGNTKNKSVSYTVDNFEFNSLASGDPVYETINESFSSDQDVGSMVNEIEYKLYYESNQTDSATTNYNSKTLGDTTSLYHEIPLVSTDGTNKNWYVKADINYTDVNGNTQTQNIQSSTKSQTVNHAYKFGSHNLVDGFTQLEASTLEYTAKIANQTTGINGQLNNEQATFKQTTETRSLTKNDLEFTTDFDSDLITSNQETHDIQTNITFNFNGNTRKITDSKTVTLDKMVIDKSTGQKTLSLTTKDEEDGSTVTSDIDMGLTVNNPDQEDKTREYKFQLTGSSTHDLFIQPSYAEVTGNAFNKNTIEYQDTNQNYGLRRYYLQDETLNNQTSNINLYLLNKTDSVSIDLELLDSDLNPLPNHLVRIQRQFAGGDDKIVAKTKTGSPDGIGSVKLDPDQRYKYIIYNEEGTLVETIGPQEITSTQVTLQLDAETVPSTEKTVDELKILNTQLSGSSASLKYSSGSEKLNNIELKVVKDSFFDDQVIDQANSTQLSNTLTVDGFNATEQELAVQASAEFGSGTVQVYQESFGTTQNSYGQGGIFMSLLLFLTMTFSGLWKPSAAIGMGTIAIIVLSIFTGFMPMTQTGLIAIISIAAVLVWRMT
jgi:hypothetical protein